MQSQLEEIGLLLNNKESVDLDAIDDKLGKLHKKINETEAKAVKELDESISNAKEENNNHNITLNRLHNDKLKLQDKIKELENNRTQLQEANVQGALKLTEEAQEKAKRAVHKAESSQDDIKYAERQCKATENLVNKMVKEFENMEDEDKNALIDIQDDLKVLVGNISYLNNLICDKNGSPCDDICGGAGCGTCGDSISCSDGAKQKVLIALQLANDTEQILKEKETKANEFVRQVSQINTVQAKNIAQEAHDKALAAMNNLNNTKLNVDVISKKIKEFLEKNTTTPEQLKEMAESVRLFSYFLYFYLLIYFFIVSYFMS